MRRLTTAIALVALSALALNLAVAAAKPRVKLKRVGRFHSPTYVTSAPGVPGAVVVERGGRIRLVQGRKRPTFTNIAGLVSTSGERGLLSVAFSPDYASSRLLYVYFTDRSGELEIGELRADAEGRHANPSTLRPLVVVPHPNHSNHNGGQLQFGPDGMLYAGTGDGGGAGDQPDNAQNPNSRLGKLLQIDPGSGAVRVYSIGLRNPFRFSFDLVSDPGQPRIVIADVGQDRFDELDYLPLAAAGGANFGWNDFEGFAPYPGAHSPTPSGTVRPIKVFSLGGGKCALIGGYVVRDPKLRSLTHRYVYGDFCTGKIRSLVPRLGGARKDRGTGLRVRDLSSFGETADGGLYATSLDGPVYRLVRRR
ncbi:MAG TPA: PQQ-dependent sugar dehydrogenase [Solirubrobacterales bacterium]|nr:PQQ-dependent sugar dehydrogenase [Solirubrobacterales bacterium]